MKYKAEMILPKPAHNVVVQKDNILQLEIKGITDKIKYISAKL